MKTSITSSIICAALLVSGCASLTSQQPSAPDIQKSFINEGWNDQHIQGVASDGRHLFLTYTTKLFKTDLSGKILKSVDKLTHHGDCCFADGKLYVAVNLGEFNQNEGADSWIYIYDANLNLLDKKAVPELVHGAGGIECLNGKLHVVGGGVAGKPNYVYEYDAEFKFIKRRELPAWDSVMGIQTICYNDGYFYFGCYANGDGTNGYTMRTDSNFQNPQKIAFRSAVGICALQNSDAGAPRFLIAENFFARPDSMKNWLKSAVFLPAVFKDGNFIVEDDCSAECRKLKV